MTVEFVWTLNTKSEAISTIFYYATFVNCKIIPFGPPFSGYAHAP